MKRIIDWGEIFMYTASGIVILFVILLLRNVYLDGNKQLAETKAYEQQIATQLAEVKAWEQQIKTEQAIEINIEVIQEYIKLKGEKNNVKKGDK